MWVKMDRVINRVIPNFVALCNKLVFCPIFTRVGLKNQVGEGDFTLGRQQSLANCVWNKVVIIRYPIKIVGC